MVCNNIGIFEAGSGHELNEKQREVLEELVQKGGFMGHLRKKLSRKGWGDEVSPEFILAVMASEYDPRIGEFHGYVEAFFDQRVIDYLRHVKSIERADRSKGYKKTFQFSQVNSTTLPEDEMERLAMGGFAIDGREVTDSIVFEENVRKLRAAMDNGLGERMRLPEFLIAEELYVRPMERMVEELRDPEGASVEVKRTERARRLRDFLAWRRRARSNGGDVFQYNPVTKRTSRVPRPEYPKRLDFVPRSFGVVREMSNYQSTFCYYGQSVRALFQDLLDGKEMPPINRVIDYDEELKDYRAAVASREKEWISIFERRHKNSGLNRDKNGYPLTSATYCFIFKDLERLNGRSGLGNYEIENLLGIHGQNLWRTQNTPHYKNSMDEIRPHIEPFERQLDFLLRNGVRQEPSSVKRVLGRLADFEK
jgi:hypothetical protein